MKQLGIPFEAVDPGDAENSVSKDPVTHVKAHALAKAEAVAPKYPDKIIIAADTIVVLDGKILEKPRNREEAKVMLHALCGKTHTVISAITIIKKKKASTKIEETKVTMKTFTEEEIEAYIETGEPMDKAGAYAAQGLGAFIIERVDGCFYNVVGLPLSLLYDMLRDAGVEALIKKSSI